MNKKINFLAIIPLFGSVILFLWLFVKMIKGEIFRKKYNFFFFCCGLVGMATALIVPLSLAFIFARFGIEEYLATYGLLAFYIIAGYAINVFSFILLNKKWDGMQTHETYDDINMWDERPNNFD